MPRWMATEEDRLEAIRRLLTGLAHGEDLEDLSWSVADLHRKNNTFPGEVFMHLAADALEAAEARRGSPIPYEGLRERHLEEYNSRGRENLEIQYAILTSAAVRGGLEPDLLEEVTWWRTDDYWRYALLGAIAIIRAGAEHIGMPVAAFVGVLADRHGVALD